MSWTVMEGLAWYASPVAGSWHFRYDMYRIYRKGVQAWNSRRCRAAAMTISISTVLQKRSGRRRSRIWCGASATDILGSEATARSLSIRQRKQILRWRCIMPMAAGRRCAATAYGAWRNTFMTKDLQIKLT